MSRVLVTAFFNEEWVRDNALDILRAQEMTRQARAELDSMSSAQLAAEFDWLLSEAGEILAREN